MNQAEDNPGTGLDCNMLQQAATHLNIRGMPSAKGGEYSIQWDLSVQLWVFNV